MTVHDPADLATPTHGASAYRAAPSGDGVPKDIEGIRADIASTRAELGDTVEALSGKFDVKANMGRALHGARESIEERAATGVRVLHDVPMAAIVIGLGGVVAAGLMLWRALGGKR